MTLATQLGVAFVWGGLMALERKAFLQAMFSRPVVAATMMGLLLGDTLSGLYIGMVLELFHLGSASLGAAIPEHETLAATGTTAAAAALSRSTGSPSTSALWAISILALLWLGPAGRKLDRYLERFASRSAQKAIDRAGRGELSSAMRQNLWAMWPHFLCFGGVTALCFLAGTWVAPLWPGLPLPLVRGLAWAYPAIGSVAAAMGVRGSRARQAPFYGGAAAAVVALSAAVFSLWKSTP
jgi:mannose/fructose/N-acetylgalactosamine-specific phosphotransferase system component IIC